MIPLALPSDAPLLRAAILACLLLVPMTMLLLVFDRRVLDGEPLWLKPLKFHLSLALHGATVLLLARLLPGAWQTHLLARIGFAVFGAVILYEVLFLSLQAGRGVRSHFNSTTAFDAIGGTIMAAGAGVLVAVPLLLGLALLASLVRDGCAAAASDPLRIGAALGLVLAGWLGGQSGGAIGANGGPFVGAAEAGPVLPLTGWSLSGGDYRIAHFLGLHAMQALPILAVLLTAILPPLWTSAAMIPAAAIWAAATLAVLSRAGAGLPPF